MFSKYLKSQETKCKEIVNELSKTFKYVSILATDVKNINYRVLKNSTDISDSMFSECGFVIKMSNGNSFFEYSLDNLDMDTKELANKVINDLKISKKLENKMVNTLDVDDLPLVKDFERKSDFNQFNDKIIISKLEELNKLVQAKSKNILNVLTGLNTLDVNKLFVSKNRCLTQHYTWCNLNLVLIYQNNSKLVQPRESTYSNNISECFLGMKDKIDKLLIKAECLSKATAIKPGVYDIITDASITGLIAHEAFGHGVEMDQFVKDRAMAKNCMGEFVASEITTLKDGATSGFSTASYFFDDDGVLAQDTTIINNGRLVSGICDLVSSRQLGVNPTGNGRRENYKHKAYTRMTNTFIAKGSDSLEDMIKSIKHGYFLCETNNGMEDPKNWNIQCTAEYGIEIIDGKLTDNYVSPVVMSGSVPELLKSISMVSDDFELEGAGSCGKGYKEWVRVSSGGSNIKARCKLS